MAEEQDKSQRTEQPTPKRLEDARKKGQVPASKEPSTAIAFWVLGMLGVVGAAGAISDSMLEMMHYYLSGKATLDPSGDGMRQLLIATAADLFAQMLPVALPVMLLGMLASFLVSGPVFSFEPIKPKLEKINPLKGIRRLFSARSLAEFIKSLLKLIVLSLICAKVVMGLFAEILRAVFLDPYDISALMVEAAMKLILWASVAYTALALVDVLYQRWAFMRSMRMSRKELRDEFKESEGDPQLKAKIRQIQMQQAQRRMMADVPKADVVITNPTHLAVALRYDPTGPHAPRVVAKGRGLVAARIKEIAQEHGVPLRENKPLARSLFEQVAIGDEIPEEMFEAVAIILAEIFRLREAARR